MAPCAKQTCGNEYLMFFMISYALVVSADLLTLSQAEAWSFP